MLPRSLLPDWWIQSELFDYIFHLGMHTVPTYLHLLTMLVVTLVFWKLYKVPDSMASTKRIVRTVYYVGHVMTMLLGLAIVDGGMIHAGMSVGGAMMAILFSIVGISSERVIRSRLVGDITEAKRLFSNMSARTNEQSSIPYSGSSSGGLLQADFDRRFEERLPALEAAVVENCWCFPTSKRKQSDRLEFLLEVLSEPKS